VPVVVAIAMVANIAISPSTPESLAESLLLEHKERSEGSLWALFGAKPSPQRWAIVNCDVGETRVYAGSEWAETGCPRASCGSTSDNV